MAALIQWRYHRKHDEAAQLLEAAIERGCDKLPALLALSRLERDRGDFGKAWSMASRARLEAQGPVETRKARIECARVVVEECVQAASAGTGSGNTCRLQEVRADLLGLLKDGQDSLAVCQLLLRAAILLGDGETALRAWHSYFRVDPQEKAYGVLARPQQTLSKLWPAWKGSADGQEAHCRLIQSLADSRLYEEAVILADRYAVGDNAPAEIKDILVYGRAMRELEKFIGEQYRLYFGAQTDRHRGNALREPSTARRQPTAR
jgi:tetratricopeptide (TPR) repeat protein